MRAAIAWVRVTLHCALREYLLCEEIVNILLTDINSPSLMGQHTGLHIADASLQARVVDTILVNATAIFDDD